MESNQIKWMINQGKLNLLHEKNLQSNALDLYSKYFDFIKKFLGWSKYRIYFDCTSNCSISGLLHIKNVLLQFALILWLYLYFIHCKNRDKSEKLKYFLLCNKYQKFSNRMVKCGQRHIYGKTLFKPQNYFTKFFK